MEVLHFSGKEVLKVIVWHVWHDDYCSLTYLKFSNIL